MKLMGKHVPFTKKEKEPIPVIMQNTDEPEDKTRTTDWVDLASQLFVVEGTRSGVTKDWVKFHSDDNDEEFFRGMLKCAVNAELMITQAAERVKAKELARWDELPEREREAARRKTLRDYETTLKIAKMARKNIIAEPDMVAALKRNRQTNWFAKGIFDNEGKDEKEDEGVLASISKAFSGGKEEKK